MVHLMHSGVSPLRDTMVSLAHIIRITGKKECQFMRKFITQQAVHCLPISSDNPLRDLLITKSAVTPSCSSIFSFFNSSVTTLEALLLHKKRLDTPCTFSNNGIVVPLPPIYMRVFDPD